MTTVGSNFSVDVHMEPSPIHMHPPESVPRVDFINGWTYYRVDGSFPFCIRLEIDYLWSLILENSVAFPSCIACHVHIFPSCFGFELKCLGCCH